jgi:Rod binding domain-containing protein
MQELLKPMERDPLFSSGGGSGLMSGDAGAGTWSSLGAQSLAKALSDAGGLGIATKMISEVEAEARAAQAGKIQGTGNAAGSLAGSGAGREACEASRTEMRPLGGEHDLSSWSTVRRLP